MAERGSIVMDIRAQVSGYELSLRKLQAEFAKVDPGTLIGKSLARAILIAETLLRALNKNLTPRVTNDTLIDNTVLKVNNLGDAILNVSNLMRLVTTDDINFSVANTSIEELTARINTLEATLNGNITEGFMNAIQNSLALSLAFSDLGLLLEGKTKVEIFDLVIKKSQEAALNVTLAEKEVASARKLLAASKEKVTKLELNPIYNKDVVTQELSLMTQDYTNAIEFIRELVQSGLNLLFLNDPQIQLHLLEAFMGGLTPETLEEHLLTLKNTISDELQGALKPSQIYETLFGGYVGKANNSTAIASVLRTLFPSLEQMTQLLLEFFKKFLTISTTLTDNQVKQILPLISQGDISTALELTLRYIEDAYKTLLAKMLKARQGVLNSEGAVTNAEEQLLQAKYDEAHISTIINTLLAKLDLVSLDNLLLQDEINRLRDERTNQKERTASDIRNNAGSLGSIAREFELSSNEILKYKDLLSLVHEKELLVGKIEGVVLRWFSIYAAVRMVGNAIRSVISTLKELDATITEIAIVTNMTLKDLWNQMSDYTAMALKYAASISGVYKVSQLYYQQGLLTADVMELTELTLKMARISGLDYAEATDYMTNAIRSFKMEMTDAQRVVDVYSAIAAKSATNVTELAEAMSKTASSAESVGSSFENTTAMMAVMIEATRESATNIGSALKSIISRYGEMKADPSKMVDSEGEEMSLNKVDKALLSVGISIHDVNGLFRDFDDVIMELAASWNTIDKNTQRYIATVMAGNRQQSRFLALVSSYDRLKQLSAEAANAEDASQLQFLKTLDSIAAKTQQLQTSLLNLYVDSGLERFYGFLIDAGKSIVDTFNNMPKLFDLPILAISKFGVAFWGIARIVTAVAKSIRTKLLTESKVTENLITIITLLEENKRLQELLKADNLIILSGENKATKMGDIERLITEATIAENEKRIASILATNAALNNTNKTGLGWRARLGDSIGKAFSKEGRYMGQTMLGLGLSSIGSSIASGSNLGSAGAVTGGLMSIAGSALSGFAMSGGNPLGTIIGGVIGLILNIPNMIVTAQERLNQLEEEAELKNNEAIKARSEANTFNQQLELIRKLEKARYDNAEAEEEYYEAANRMAETYPELIKNLDDVGNATIDTVQAEKKLKDIRAESTQAANDAAVAEYKAQKERERLALEEANAAVNIPLMSEDTGTRSMIMSGLIENKGAGVMSTWFQNNSDMTGLYTMIRDGRIEYQLALDEFYDISDEYNFTSIQLLKFIGYVLDSYKRYSELPWEDLIHEYEQTNISNANSSEQKYLQEQEKTSQVLFNNFVKSINSSLIGIEENYLEDIPDVVGIMAKAVQQKFTDSGYTDLKAFLSDVLPELENTYTEFWENFYENLGTDEIRSNFVQLFKSNKKISRNEMEKLLEAWFKKDDNDIDEIEKAMIDSTILYYYDDSYDKEKFLNRYNPLEGREVSELANTITEYHEELYDNLGSSELLAINTFYDYLENNLITNGGSLSMRLALDVLNNYLTIGEKLSTIEDSNLKEQAEAIFYSWDGSLSNLIEIERLLKDLGIDTTIWIQINEIIERLKTEIPINFSMALLSYADSVSLKMEDYEKDLSNVTKGLNLKDAVDMALKINKDLSAFDFRNGRYYLKDIADLEEKYFDDTEYLDALNNKKLLRELAYNDYSAILLNIKNSSDINFKLGNNRKILAWNTKLTNFLSEIGMSLEQLLSIYDTYSSEMASVAKDELASFQDWLIAQNNAEYDLIVSKTEQYKLYTKAASYLTSGDIINFLKTAGIKDEDITQDLIQKIVHGDISNLPEQLQLFAKLIYDTYHSIYSSITDNMLKAAEGGSNKIEVTSTNLLAIQDAIEQKWINDSGKLIEGTFVEINVQKLKESEEAFSKWIQTAYDNEQDRYKALISFHNIEYTDISGSMSSIITNNGEIAYDSLMEYFETLGIESKDAAQALKDYGLELDKLTGTVKIIDLNEYIRQLKEDAQQFKNDTEKYNETMAKLYDAEHYEEIQRKNAYEQVLKNYNSLSSADRANFAIALGLDFDLVAQYFEENGDGTFKLNINEIRKALEEGTLGVSEATEIYLQELIYDIADNYLDTLSTAVSYATLGTTKQADMRKFVNDYKEVVGKEISLNKAFNWNDTLLAFVLDSEVLNEYIEKLRQNIKDKFGTDAAEKWLAGQVKQYQNTIDVSGYLSSDRTTQDRELLKQLIKAAFILQNKDYDDTLINRIEKGGEDAIIALKEIKPEASSKEIQNVYRAVVDDLLNALDAISSLTAGLIIATNGALYDALAILNMVDTTNGVIKDTFNMVEAYNKIYETMKVTAGKTQSDLNKAYANVLTAGEQQEIDAIEAMSNAMGMTYYQLGELLGKYGEDLEEFINNLTDNSIIEKIGNGKIRINDFNAFAQEMGWEYGSEEYLSAFKAYNDSLVKLNRQTEKSILEEVKNVIAANRGDKVNLTYLIDTLGAGAEQILNEQLKEYGASIKNGILTISEGADLIGISLTIQNAAENSGKLMEEELAEITDSITEAINNYSELLIKGITGNLTNVDLLKLMKDSGLLSVTYEKTADGLKLTQEYLIRLYSAMDAGVNKIKVFDELNKYLQENNEHYKTAGANLARISELNKLRVEEAKKLLDTSGAISKADKQISLNRLKQYSQELAVAEKIAAVRATTEDSSYSFMDQEMPGGFQNPINYWESWGKAMKSIQEAGENGYIGIQDYYNMITHIQDLAVLTGKDMKFMGMTISLDGTSAAELIERGFKAMTLDVESGNTVLSLDKLSAELGEIGFDFKAGAEGFDENIQDGIHKFAQSQVDMLDSMIKFVETIVAMEKLGDLDIKGDGIDFSDIFSKSFYDPGKGVTWNYTELYQEVAQTLLESGKDLEGITVAGYTLKQILEDAKDGIKDITIENDDLVALLQALYSTSISQNYNLSDIYNSILETFLTNGISGELSLGLSKIYVDAPSGIILEFSDENNHWLYNGKDLGDDPQEALKQALAMRAEESENFDVEVPETIKVGDKTVELPIHNTFILSVDLIDAHAAKANVNFVEKPENPGSIPELEATTSQANITKIGAVSWDSKGIINNKDLGTITSADIVGALNLLGINNISQLSWATTGVTAPTGFNGNAPLTADNILAVLSALGINDVKTLSWQLGNTITGTFGTALPITMQAVLQSLGITDVKEITPTWWFLNILARLKTLELDTTLKGLASGAEVGVNSNNIDTAKAKSTILEEAGTISLDEAIATFASLIVEIASATNNGNGTTSGGMNTTAISQALDDYKTSLRTANENGALEALFTTLGIDINNTTPESLGALRKFLTKASLEEKELFINFATMLLGWTGKTYSGNGDSLAGGTGTGDVTLDTSLINAINHISTLNEDLLSVFFATILTAVTTNTAKWDSGEEDKYHTALLALGFTNEEIDALITAINVEIGNKDSEGNDKLIVKDAANILSALHDILTNTLGLPEEIIQATIKYILASTTDAQLSQDGNDAEDLRNKVIELLGGDENGEISIDAIDAIIAGYNLTLLTGLEEPNPEDFNSRKEYKLAFQEYIENQTEQEKNKLIWNDYLNEIFSTGNIDSLKLVIQAITSLSGGAIIEEDGVSTLDFGNLQAYTALTKLIFVPASTYAASLSEQDRQVFINSLTTELNRAGWHITPDVVWANIKATQIKTVIEGADEEGNIIIDGEKTSLANYLSRELTNLLQDETISPSARIEALNLLINSLTSDPNSKIKINNDGSWSVDGQTVTLGVTNFIINAVTQSALNTELPLNIKFDPSVHNLFIDENELANFIKAEDEGNLKTALELLLSKLFNGLGLEALIELANAYIAAFSSLLYNGTPNATYTVTFDENGMPLFKLSSSILPEGEIGSVEGKAISSDKKTTVTPEDGMTFDIGKISVTATIEKVSGALANGLTSDAADLVADGLEKYGIKELDELVFSIGGNLVLDFSDINMNDSNVDESLKNAFYKEGATAKEKLQAILSLQFSSMLKDDAITLTGLTFSLAENKIYIKAVSDGTYKVYDKEGAELKPIVDVDGNIVGFTQVNENTNTLEGFDLYAPITGLIDPTQVQEAINQGKYSVNAEVNPNGGSKAGGDVETRDLGGGTKGWPFGGGGGHWENPMLDPVNDWRTLVKPFSKGNIALASGTTTLMGELGPELVVSNGRYFVVGQNGAEFINLPKDAIVFNHLQTQRLMNNGTSGRGKPVTNEKNAVAYAAGTGPAMASASSVLATLKHLRSQWQAIADMSIADLAGKGGGGGGGGQEDLPGFIRDVERWYNWLLKIADLEKLINYEETLRSKIQSDMVSNGKAYYASLKRQLDLLRDSTITSSSLYLSLLDYFNQRREQLNNNSPLSELYTFDTTGQLHYQPGSYQWLALLFKTNDYGQLELTPQLQYEMIMKRNPQFAQYMKYNSEGKEIKASDYEDLAQYYLDMVKAFSDRMDSEKEEMQSLFDSINEQGNAVNEKLLKQNELILAMRDNLKEVEESVLGAIVESREREIKKIQDTKDALQKSNEDFINGLSDQLEKERKLYDNNQNDEELNRSRRLLAILQRSGGSAAQIASLQKQIEEQSRDLYFEKQQEQIDAVKEASDLLIERLDRQIELMNETLEYQKANGLLWGQVYEVMAGTPLLISDFIMQNTAAEWAKSPLSSTEAANDWIFKTEQWVSFRDDIEGIYNALTATWNLFDKEMEDMFGKDIWSGANKDAIKDIFNAKYAETGDYNAAAEAVMQSDIYKGMKNKLDALTTSSYLPTNTNLNDNVGTNNEYAHRVDYEIYTYDERGIRKTVGNLKGYGLGRTEAEAKAAAEYYAKQKALAAGIKYPDINYTKAYKNGGLIDFTGPAWVDGTKQRPESIWDAETTKLMKDNLLNSRNLNLLSTFWDTLQDYQTATNHSYSNNSESLVIENAVVNMNVASIANDYDARRAGEQAMEEMLRIARKTRVSNF